MNSVHMLLSVLWIKSKIWANESLSKNVDTWKTSKLNLTSVTIEKLRKKERQYSKELTDPWSPRSMTFFKNVLCFILAICPLLVTVALFLIDRHVILLLYEDTCVVTGGLIDVICFNTLLGLFVCLFCSLVQVYLYKGFLRPFLKRLGKLWAMVLYHFLTTILPIYLLWTLPSVLFKNKESCSMTRVVTGAFYQFFRILLIHWFMLICSRLALRHLDPRMARFAGSRWKSYGAKSFKISLVILMTFFLDLGTRSAYSLVSLIVGYIVSFIVSIVSSFFDFVYDVIFWILKLAVSLFFHRWSLFNGLVFVLQLPFSLLSANANLLFAYKMESSITTNILGYVFLVIVWGVVFKGFPLFFSLYSEIVRKSESFILGRTKRTVRLADPNRNYTRRQKKRFTKITVVRHLAAISFLAIVAVGLSYLYNHWLFEEVMFVSVLLGSLLVLGFDIRLDLASVVVVVLASLGALGVGKFFIYVGEYLLGFESVKCYMIVDKWSCELLVGMLGIVLFPVLTVAGIFAFLTGGAFMTGIGQGMIENFSPKNQFTPPSRFFTLFRGNTLFNTISSLCCTFVMGVCLYCLYSLCVYSAMFTKNAIPWTGGSDNILYDVFLGLCGLIILAIAAFATWMLGVLYYRAVRWLSAFLMDPFIELVNIRERRKDLGLALDNFIDRDCAGVVLDTAGDWDWRARVDSEAEEEMIDTWTITKCQFDFCDANTFSVCQVCKTPFCFDHFPYRDCCQSVL